MQNPIRQNETLGPHTTEQVSPPVSFAALNARGLKIAGVSNAGSGYRMHRPRALFGHLLVTLGGAGHVWTDGRWVECPEGFAYVSPAYGTSAFETMTQRRWQFAWVFFDRTGYEGEGLFAGDQSSLVRADARPLATAIEGLYHEGLGAGDATLLEQWAELIHIYSTRIIRPASSRQIDPLARLWMEVDSQPAADWSIASLSEQAGMSSEKLRKLCLTHHGRSPMEQVTHLRLCRADTLLQSTGAKLAVIARMVGYTNVFAFSTAFRRAYHVPPSERR